jgi:molybdopterin converting factor small subunit
MLKKLVIIPGGFHPFHAGHKALYDAAVEAFPRADVYIAATDDQNTRPFPFRLKQQLAQIAGIPKHRFIQVKSPFRPIEITQHYNPEDTQLIFVRSDKDSGVAPLPGGVKKDGSAGYLQPLNRRAPEPMTQHGFMTYLPTVSFGPGMSSATEIRAKWPTMSDDERTSLVSSLYPSASESVVNKAKEIFSTVLGDNTVATVDEATIINKGDTVDILPSGGLGTHSEQSLKDNIAKKLRSLADVLESGNYTNLEHYIYKSGAMQAMVEALGQYQRFNDKRGNRPIKKDVEIDISNEGVGKDIGSAIGGIAGTSIGGAPGSAIGSAIGGAIGSKFDVEEDYLPENELVEYAVQSRPLRVLDNIASRSDSRPFPIKFDDGSTVEVTPEIARKFMAIFLKKHPDIQKEIDDTISIKKNFINTFNALMKGTRRASLIVRDPD